MKRDTLYGIVATLSILVAVLLISICIINSQTEQVGSEGTTITSKELPSDNFTYQVCYFNTIFEVYSYQGIPAVKSAYCTSYKVLDTGLDYLVPNSNLKGCATVEVYKAWYDGGGRKFPWKYSDNTTIKEVYAIYNLETSSYELNKRVGRQGEK